jgi:hypothetical protein
LHGSAGLLIKGRTDQASLDISPKPLIQQYTYNVCHVQENGERSIPLLDKNFDLMPDENVNKANLEV